MAEREYVGSFEAAKRTNHSQAYITKLCREGKIKGAEQDAPGKPWRIPIDSLTNLIKGGKK